MPGPGKPFQAGKDARRNPGGRPRAVVEVVEAARLHTTEAIEKLAYWMRTDNAKASVTACIALLERGWGKPAQLVKTDEDGENAVFEFVLRKKENGPEA